MRGELIPLPNTSLLAGKYRQIPKGHFGNETVDEFFYSGILQVSQCTSSLDRVAQCDVALD